MATKNKHILLVSSEFPPLPGGIGHHAYNLAQHISAENIGVSVIADQRTVTGQEERDFDGKLNFKVHRVALQRFRFIMYFTRIWLLFTHVKTADVVMASGKFSLWIVAFVSLFYKRNYVAVIHGTEVNFTHKTLKKAVERSLKRFAKVIAVSQYTKSLVAEVHPNIVVIPNGIDLKTLAAVSPERLDLKGSPKLITVGNVTARKGQLNVIKQLPELLKVYPDLHYYIVGLPTEKAAFLEVAEALGVAHHITFHGRASHQEFYNFLHSCDVFVMLSQHTTTGDVEGFGIALLEANYFGLACIGATGCGIADAIKDGYSGRLVSNTSSVQFIDALQDIMSHKDSYREQSKIWAHQYSWSSIIKTYLKAIYS